MKYMKIRKFILQNCSSSPKWTRKIVSIGVFALYYAFNLTAKINTRTNRICPCYILFTERVSYILAPIRSVHLFLNLSYITGIFFRFYQRTSGKTHLATCDCYTLKISLLSDKSSCHEIARNLSHSSCDSLHGEMCNRIVCFLMR